MLTQSSLNLYRACPRRFRWRYVDGWRDTALYPELEVGTLVHLGLEWFWSGHSWSDTRRKLINDRSAYFHANEGLVRFAQILAYVEGYFQTYDLDDWETLGVEEVFNIEIQGIPFSGKLDARARRKSDGRQFLIEHKTSGNPNENYWRKLANGMDAQLVLYSEAVKIMTGEECGFLYDVIAKHNSGPTYRMVDGKIPKPRKRKKETDEEFSQRKANMMETLEEYQQRLAHNYIKSGANYQRKIITCTAQEHQNALEDLLFIARQVEASKKENRFPRSSSNCWSYGRNCEYFNICTGADTPETSGHLNKETDLHPELNTKEKLDEPF